MSIYDVTEILIVEKGSLESFKEEGRLRKEKEEKGKMERKELKKWKIEK